MDPRLKEKQTPSKADSNDVNSILVLQAKANDLNKYILELIKEEHHAEAIQFGKNDNWQDFLTRQNNYRLLIQHVHENNVNNANYWINWKDNLFTQFSNVHTSTVGNVPSKRNTPFNNLQDCFLSDMQIKIYVKNFDLNKSAPICFDNYNENSATFYYDKTADLSSLFSGGKLLAAFLHVLLDITNSQFLLIKQTDSGATNSKEINMAVTNSKPALLSGTDEAILNQQEDIFWVEYVNPFTKKACLLLIEKNKIDFDHLEKIREKLELNWSYLGVNFNPVICQKINSPHSLLSVECLEQRNIGTFVFACRNNMEHLVAQAVPVVSKKIPALVICQIIPLLHDGKQDRENAFLSMQALSEILKSLTLKNQICVLGEAFDYIQANLLQNYALEKPSGVLNFFEASGKNIAIDHIAILRNKLQKIIENNLKCFNALANCLDAENVRALIDYNVKTGFEKVHGKTDLRQFVDRLEWERLPNLTKPSNGALPGKKAN